MNQYSWTSAYTAAIEERDRVTLQKQIRNARKVMAERLSRLVTGSMANGESEEFQRLCDARRALDLLERVSNNVDLFPPPEMRKSA